MASTCRCEYCGQTISTSNQTCPNCGAANPLFVIDTDRIITDPQTIEELKEYCAERGMPLVRMRFFIGEDYREPKAFGIYRDAHGDIVVYKNKADGTRAIRYKGKDEKYAVNEIYGKLLLECHNRGIYPDGKSNTPHMSRSMGTSSGGTGSNNYSSFSGSYNSSKRTKRLVGIIVASFLLPIVICIIVFLIVFFNLTRHPNGYYKYDDTMYYLKGSNWYYYDDTADDWYGVNNSITDSIYDGGKEYYQEDGWNSDWGESFYNSDAYKSYQESHSSSSDDYSSSDYSSDYSDWDSGSTDWDSDW